MKRRWSLSSHQPNPNIDDYYADVSECVFRSDLGRLFQSHKGSFMNKWVHYFDAYSEHFESLRQTPVKLLEIGVSHGGSLELWRQYFGPSATIFGIDKNAACKNVAANYAEVRIGDQSDEEFLGRVVDEMDGLDLVIDDGSHVSRDQMTTFRVLFERLSEGGLYAIEDTHTSYWPSYGGGMGGKGSIISAVKTAIDDMHCEYSGQRMRFLSGSTPNVGSISIYDSLVVITKKMWSPPKQTQVGSRRF